jgi:rsbT co-antagonist protein RsbR
MSNETFAGIANDRLRRVIDVLSIASLGEFDPARVVIPLEGREDDFAMLEQTVNVLVSELAEAKHKNDRAAEAIERSRDQLAEKLQTIERQQTAIRDLSTPIIELWDDILTLPIVGLVDTQRSVEMTERLLHRIVDRRARCVIIDVTGVDEVDTATADHFVKMIRAAQLLGAHCVVTGISPEIAQTLVRIGVELTGVRTLRSLKEGLKECMALLKR